MYIVFVGQCAINQICSVVYITTAFHVKDLTSLKHLVFMRRLHIVLDLTRNLR